MNTAEEEPLRAVRGELRAALSDLSDTLGGAPPPDPAAIYDALRHTWILADLAELDESSHSLVTTVLRDLHRDIRDAPHRLDAPFFANQLAAAADKIWR